MPSIKKKYRKDAGELVHPIEIQRKEMQSLNNGIVKETWTTIYSPRCSVSNNTGKETVRQNLELYGQESKKFTFRTHPEVEVRQKDIIIYKEERWEIISIYDYDDLGIFMVAIAKKVYQ